MYNDLKDMFTTILTAVGENLERDGLRETPDRAAKAWMELLSGYFDSPYNYAKTFDNVEQVDQLVLVRNVPIFSVCEHHLLPFFGFANIGYIPNKRILGVSKIIRAARAVSRKLQVQERLTQEILQFLVDSTEPLGAGVVVQAHHMCMQIRGVQEANASMVTSAFHGALLTNIAAREEFFHASSN